MTPPRRITVVGAGVIGLTTALDLAAAGHDVTVLTADPPAATTSAIAGAIWFPYQVGPPDRAIRWAARTRARWAALAADRATRRRRDHTESQEDRKSVV